MTFFAAEPFRELDDWLSKYRSLWEARFDRLRTALDCNSRAARPRARRNRMSDENTSATRPKVVIERSYRARVEELWELWTTKKGFESWWGPEGFRVEVHALEARVGRALHYDMIADAPEMIETMRLMDRPSSHSTRGTFVEIKAHERLAITHMIDFLPGVKAYVSTMLVEFFPSGENVHMVITLDPMHDEEFTRMSRMGFTSQLTKLDKRFEKPSTPPIVAVARASYQAYVDKDRQAIEVLLADDFHFTSPLDNWLDRATYFARCWPNSQTIAGFDFIHLVPDGDRVFVTYEGKTTGGKRFRNTEIVTVRNGKIIDAEVYFGWDIPHQAVPGGFVGPDLD
jgi:uncharacterized protein YndB with AHSA1/START domain/ketosteroid isomerase-like protein